MTKNEGFRPMSPENIKTAKIAEGELLRGGADIDEEGHLTVKEGQVEKARKEMDIELRARDLSKVFSAYEVSLLVSVLDSGWDQNEKFFRSHFGSDTAGFGEAIKTINEIKRRFGDSVPAMQRIEREREQGGEKP